MTSVTKFQVLALDICSVDSTKSRSMDIWKSQVHSGEKTISFHRETKENNILRHTLLITNHYFFFFPSPLPLIKKISFGLLVRGGAVLLWHQVMPAIVKNGRHLGCLQSLDSSVRGARSWGRGASSPHLQNSLAGTLRYGVECDCRTPLGLWSNGCSGRPRRVVPQPVTLPDGVERQRALLQPHRAPLPKKKKWENITGRTKSTLPFSGVYELPRVGHELLLEHSPSPWPRLARHGRVRAAGQWLWMGPGEIKKKGQHKRNKSFGCLLPFSVLDVVRLHQHAKFQDTPSRHSPGNARKTSQQGHGQPSPSVN